MKGLQLPLGVQLSDTTSFESYYAGPNREAAAALRALPAPGSPPLLFLFGPAGSGKTHLLQALTREAAGQHACAYVPLRLLASEGPSVLEGLDRADLVCLDDLEAVLHDPAWLLPLLRFLDRLQAQGARGALSAAASPDRLALVLPDLATRLSAAAVYGLKPFSDADRSELLRERARARGLELPQDSARYLLSRLPRDTGSLMRALDALDKAALSAKRRLTLPFVQRWCKETAQE